VEGHDIMCLNGLKKLYIFNRVRCIKIFNHIIFIKIFMI